jgi:hypothetical protein
MKLPQTGGCQCGKIRYEITEAPTLVYTCHVRDCQRLTSSAFSMGIVVAEAAFKLGGVDPRALQRLADSGRTSIRWVCPECGARGSPARRGMGWSVSGRVRSTIHRGPGRPGIYRPEASSPGSRSPRGIRVSRRNRPHSYSRCTPSPIRSRPHRCKTPHRSLGEEI